MVLAALQQWGDEHLPPPEGPSMLRRVAGTDCPVHVGYIDPDGREVSPDGFAMIPDLRRRPAKTSGKTAKRKSRSVRYKCL